MPTYIKTGYWDKLSKAPKGYLNLDLITGGGSTGAEDVTYAQLYDDTVNGLLVPGKWYRVTDYRSVNFLNGWQTANDNPTPTDPNFNPRQIHVGDVEVLVVQAISSYQIAEVGYSETYKGHIVQYEPSTNKIGLTFDVYNGQTLPNSSVVSGFDLQWDGTNVYFNMPAGYSALFGHFFNIYIEFFDGVDDYYQEGLFEPLLPGVSIPQYSYSSDNPSFGYPKTMSRIKVVDDGTKVILLDLTQTDYNNYVADTLYVQTIYGLGDAYGWITKRHDVFRNIEVPFDFVGIRYRRFEVDLSALNPLMNIGFYGIGDNYRGQGTTGNYKDFKVFEFEGYNNVYNIKWNWIGGPDGGRYYRGDNDNNVFLGSASDIYMGDGFTRNTLSNSFRQSIIDKSFSGNSIAGSFQGNKIGDDFQDNIIGTGFSFNITSGFFYNNNIGNNFGENTIRRSFQNNRIGDFFSNNVVASGVLNVIGNSFMSNTFDVGLSQNTIGDDFNNNTVMGDFGSNVVGNSFQRNIINAYFLYFINFTSATHVYGNYSCQIFTRSNGTNQLSYVNGSNVVQYTAVNA